jgi:hypothetical protein
MLLLLCRSPAGPSPDVVEEGRHDLSPGAARPERHGVSSLREVSVGSADQAADEVVDDEYVEDGDGEADQ